MAILISFAVCSSSSGNSSGSSICIKSDGERVVNNDADDYCNGEIHLIANNIVLGIHHFGSYGTKAFLKTSWRNAQLGLLANYNRDPYWNSSSMADWNFSGDDIIPGLPVEGKSFT